MFFSISDLKIITAFRCLAHYFTTKEKNRGGKSTPVVATDIPYLLKDNPVSYFYITHASCVYVVTKTFVTKNVSFFTLLGSTPTKEAIDKSNDFPHIVMFVDEELPSSFFIAIDKQLVVQCATLQKAIFCLLIVHYVFNSSYHKRVSDLFLFLQEKVMGISSESYDIEGYKGPAKSASYLSTTTGIESYFNGSEYESD